MKISSLLSDYLKADDLQGHEVSVVISQIKFEKMDGKDKPILFFLGKSKGLMLNKTNIKAIIALYGDETNSWNGKEITLFPKMVDFQGESVNAIRVKGPLSADPRYSAELSSTDPISTSPRRMTGGVSDNLPPKRTNGMDNDIEF